MKNLKEYAQKKLPKGIALCINPARYIKPQAPNGEKYTLFCVNTFKVISAAKNINEAFQMIDDYCERR